MDETILQGIFDSLKEHVAVVDTRGIIVAANGAWKRSGQANGASSGDVGNHYLEAYENVQGQGADVARTNYEGVQTVLKGEQTYFSREYSRRTGAEQHWFCMEVKALDGQPYAVVSHHDVSDRKRADTLAQGRNQILERLAHDAPLSDILLTLTKQAEVAEPDMLCSVLLFDETGTRLEHGAAPNLPSFFMDALDGTEVGAEVGSCGAAAYSKKRVIAEDIQQHPNWVNYRRLAAQAGLRACWSEPIKDSAGQVLGTFAMYYREPRAPTAADVSFITEQATLAALAIAKSRTSADLRTSEHKFRTLAEYIPGVIYLVNFDQNFSVIYTNDAIEELLGYPREWFLEHKIQLAELLHPEDREAVERKLRTALATRQRFQMQHRMKHRRGEWRWVESTGVGVFEGDNVLYLEGFLTDVTERKEAETQVNRLAAIVEFSDDAIFSKTLAGTITSWNAGAERMFGYSAAEMLGHSVTRVLLPDQQDEEIQLFAKIHRSEIVEPFETTRLRKDGSVVAVSLGLSPIEDSSGRVVAASVIARDIGERKRDELRLRRALGDMIEAQRKEFEAREIIALSSSLTQETALTDMAQRLAKWLVDESGGTASAVLLLSGEPATPRFFGSCGLSESVNTRLGAAYGTGQPSFVDRLIEADNLTLLQNFHSEASVADAVHETNFRDLLQNDPPTWDTVLAIPLKYLGRKVGVISVCYHKDYDVPKHEKAFLEAAAKQSVYMLENARLFAESKDRAALDERSRLARELHDSVSQALYGISLGVRSARGQLGKNPEMVVARLDYALKLAEAATSEMRALIFELRPESLAQEGLVGALRKLAEANGARYHLEVACAFCDEPNLPLDTKQTIFRIVQEALHNTVKHAKARRVELSLRSNKGGLNLLLKDDGMGFDSQAVFPRHLGLHSMRERADLIGAAFELVSKVGEGTSVHLHLPLTAAPNNALAAES